MREVHTHRLRFAPLADLIYATRNQRPLSVQYNVEFVVFVELWRFDVPFAPPNLLISLESLGSNPTLSYSCLYRCIVKALHRQGSRVHDFGFSPAILYRQMSGPPELANVRFWLLPKPRVSVPEL